MEERKQLTDVLRLNLYLGEKAEVYKKKWRVDGNWSIDDLKLKWHRSLWHWPLFFLGSFWMFYRKMWKEAFLFFLIQMVLDSQLLVTMIGHAWTLVLNLIVNIVLTFVFSSIFEKKTKQVLQNIRNMSGGDEEKEIALLKEHGAKSRSWMNVFSLIVVLFVIAFALSSFLDARTFELLFG